MAQRKRNVFITFANCEGGLHFKVRFPGDFYAFDVHAPNKEAVREELRRELKCKRLPRGVEIWETTPLSEQIVRESMQKMADDYHKAGMAFDP